MYLKVAGTVLFISIMGYFFQHHLNNLEVSLPKKTHLKFSSKTRYHRERNITFKKPEHCEPLHISMVLRHGTRYPSLNDVEKIDKMLKVVEEAVTSSMGTMQIGELRLPWKNLFTHTNDKLLTTVGEREMFDIAKELLRRFPNLLLHPYEPQKFDFISTGTTRASQSAMAFAYGLFEGRGGLGTNRFQPVAILSKSIDNDPLLRFFDVCPKYLTRVKDNTTALLEFKTFKHGKEMRNVLQKVSNKLKFKSGMLEEEHIVGMYTACMFEVAIYDRENTWCELFEEEDLLVLDYLSDLKQYWKRGYGHPINYQIGCPLLERIVTSLKNATESSPEEAMHGAFMFAHGETLQPLYALLDLFKDAEMLRADNFPKQHERKYRVSRITPFGANIAFVLYKCSIKDNGSKTVEGMQSFMVQVFVNEELTALPCCKNQTECSFDMFLQCFDNTACNLSSLCSVERDASVMSPVES